MIYSLEIESENWWRKAYAECENHGIKFCRAVENSLESAKKDGMSPEVSVKLLIRLGISTLNNFSVRG